MALTAALLDANWVREPNRYNPDEGAHVGAPDPTNFLPANCKFHKLVERQFELEDYIDIVKDWLDQKKAKLNRLILASHGNNGQLFIGRGLRLENAGMFKRLNGSFDMTDGAERVVSIFGCGVASDSGVEVKDLPKNPASWPAEVRNAVTALKRLQPGERLQPLKPGEKFQFQKDRVPHLVLGGNFHDILMIQGSRNPAIAGAGYQLLKAIANCTGAYVTAPLNMEENFPPYFEVKLGSLWVYPDTKEQEEHYKFKPHNDGTPDAVVVR
jgi:hypothetical protein